MKKSNLFKQILAYTLVLSVIFSQIVFSFGASAAEVNSVWDGTKAENFAGGDGSAASPFLIDTAEQLYKMVEEYHTYEASYGKYFRITNDLYLNDVADGKSIVDLSGKNNWLAGYGDTIATASKANSFNGTLDGAGHTIYGLYVQGVKSAGLFPAISSYAVVKNLNFNNLLISGGSGYGGAIAGQAIYYTWQSAAQISNCSVVNATIGQWQNMEMVGGFLGNINDCSVTFTNCYSYDLSLSNWTSKGVPGGIVGSAYNSGTLKIINSYSAGNFPVNSLVNKAVCTNVYTDTAIPEGNTTAGVTVLTSEQMKGENAKTNMTGFDFKYIWETVENDYPVIRENPVFVWDGTTGTASNFDGGTGTENDPFLISNASQLAYIVSAGQSPTSGKYYKITKDIRINDTTIDNWKSSARNWVWYDARFAGHLDGSGHTIDGLFYNGKEWKRGLFSYVGGGSIKNLRFTNASITTTYSGDGSAAIVAAQLSAAESFSYIYIDETCEINAPNAKGVAAIAPWGGNGATIDNCAVLTDSIIGGEGKSVGAIFGTLWSGTKTVTNCFTSSSLPISGNQSFTGSNNYALVADTSGTTVLSSANDMKGSAAAENMPGLDFACIWETVEGSYPVLRKNLLYGWDGTKAENFAGGTGTKNDPFLIENGGQLYKMVADYSNASVSSKPETQTYFKLIKDINLNGKQWYVTGSTGYPSNSNYKTGFNGIIYGEGHTIYGLYSNKSSGMVGLIPAATQGAEIHDLHLESGNLPKAAWNTYAVGGLIGLAVGDGTTKPMIIDNCSVKDFVIASRDASAAFVGYLFSQSVAINNCYTINVEVSHTNTDTGFNSGAFIGVTGGNDWGNSIVITNSYSDTTSPLMYSNDAFKAITTFENVYTANEAYDGSVNGLKKLTVAQMTGVAAKANMAGFNFNQIWQDGAEGEYPTHKTNAEKAMYWNGTSADSFAGGQGTINNPYEISTADQLFLLANAGTEETKGKYYKLTSDINISKVYEGWENDNPYSWTKKTAYLDGFGYSNSFAGTLDGAGYTVRGLYYTDEITNNGTYAYGLIPFVSANAVIKNLNVENVTGDVTGNAYMGAVAGAAHVTETDVANALNMVQFVGVNLANSDLALLGGASRGVKFELCNAEEFIGSASEKISIRNCNNENYSYNDNVLIYNALNADSNALANSINYLLGNQSNYITEINGDATFDIRDLVSIKKYLAMGSSDDYKLVWSQEFNGNAVDYSVLTTNKTMSVGSTLKYADNAVVNNGSLKLSCSDTGTTDTNGDKIYSVNYGLSTIDTMSFKYGKLEMRAKVPFAAAAFPSLWLTSRNAIGYETNSEYSNEIDIFEMFGKTNNNDTLISCIHKWYNDEDGNRVLDDDGNPVECSCGSGILAGNGYKVAESDRDYQITGDAQNEYHTFVFEWDENSMSFSVDGNVYYTARKDEMSNFDISGYNTSAEGIFEQFLCIRLNNHMYTTGDGAAYKYSGDATEIDPSKINFEIDYIRLYQKNNGKINLK
ncbi:MAG: family 16 glycosylhydrolase [Clostridia bacterium]|nr:family 16 glycosylhydrolase [Clostridia bacterium]